MPWWLIMIIVIVVALADEYVDHRQENAANERRRTSENGDGTDTKALPESKASNRKGQGWSTDYEHDL